MKNFTDRFAPVSFNSITWINILLFLFVLNFGYIIRLIIASPSLPPINHFNAILGGLGMVFAVLFLSSNSNLQKDEKKFYISPILKLPLPFLGFTGALLAVDAVGVFSSVNKSLAQTGYLDFMITVYLCLLLFAIIGAIFLWTSFEVGNDGIVVVNGKIYYPGEKYILIPLFYYREIFVSNKISSQNKEILLRCSDAVGIKVSATSEVAINFIQARINGITEVDCFDFMGKLNAWTSDVLVRQSERRSYGDLLSGNNEEESTVICGLPCRWTGKIRLTNIPPCGII